MSVPVWLDSSHSIQSILFRGVSQSWRKHRKERLGEAAYNILSEEKNGVLSRKAETALAFKYKFMHY